MEEVVSRRYRTSSKNVSLRPKISPKMTAHQTRESENTGRQRDRGENQAVAVAVAVVLCCVVVVFSYRIVFYSIWAGLDEIVLYSISSNSLHEVSTDG